MKFKLRTYSITFSNGSNQYAIEVFVVNCIALICGQIKCLWWLACSYNSKYEAESDWYCPCKWRTCSICAHRKKLDILSSKFLSILWTEDIMQICWRDTKGSSIICQLKTKLYIPYAFIPLKRFRFSWFEPFVMQSLYIWIFLTKCNVMKLFYILFFINLTCVALVVALLL